MKLNLRNRFLIPTLCLIVLGMGISTAVSYFQARDAITTSVNSQITQLSKFTDSIVSSWFGDRQRDIRYWVNDKTFQAATKDSFVGQAARKAADTRLAETKNDYKYYEDIFIANTKGEIICSSNPDAVGKVKVDERSYFQESMKGQVVVSDVIKSKISGNPVSVVSAPIKEGEQIVGVFFAAVDIVYFSKLFIDPVRLGQGGYAYVADRKGLVIAHPDPSLILKENVASYDWGKEILAKGDGVATYNFKDEERLAAFNRNKELGWTVIVSTPTAEVFAPVKSQGYVNLIAAGSISLLAALVILLVVRSTVNPINRVIAGLGEASEQVATGAREVASSSQQLAEGSSEQAAALEESSSSLEEMTSMTRQNANNASQANTLMKEANQVVAKANESMQELTSSMQEISQASQQTSKIIKTIDEIAFQTNLLALNAAVEAARAGEAGAGFAVVADEVRNLAMRAAEAAKSTAGLIDGTVKKVQAGSELVSRTNQAFSEVARTSGRVDELVGEIAAASQEQAQGIEQVNKAVAEMDKVTQQTAAIAEESSGASREMSGQAEKMKRFVSELADIVGGHVNPAAKGKGPREKVAAPSSRKSSAPSLPAPNRKPKELTKRRLKEESPERVIPMDGDDFNDF